VDDRRQYTSAIREHVRAYALDEVAAASHWYATGHYLHEESKGGNMSETLVIRLRRANVFIRALWGKDTLPARDSACELCAEAANELERLTAEVGRLRKDRDEDNDLLAAAVRLIYNTHRWDWSYDSVRMGYCYYLDGKYGGLTAIDLVKLESQQHAPQ
jgi:hypothetical protein